MPSIKLEHGLATLDIQGLWCLFLLTSVGLTFIYVLTCLAVFKLLWIEQFTLQQSFLSLFPILILVIAGCAAYLRSTWVEVKLFTLFSIALVWSLISYPEASELHKLSTGIAYIGKAAAPALLLHFLFLFAGLRETLKKSDVFLPLIYLPVLPSLVHVLILIANPETSQLFDIWLNAYTIVYGLISLALLIKTIWRNPKFREQNRFAVSIFGLAAIPIFLVVSFIGIFFSFDQSLIYDVAGRYAFIGVPIAIAIAMIRYEVFDLSYIYRSHFLFIRAIMGTIVGYFVVLVVPITLQAKLFQYDDFIIIFEAVVVFFLLRVLYYILYRRWLNRNYYNTIEELRASFRIFLRDLLKVKSVHDLELLVSWNIPFDFGLKHAELSINNTPSYAYALSLPLAVGKSPLGTLFLGPKISANNFIKEELDLFSELREQIALVLFSLELDKAIQATEQLSQLRSKFLTNITHELRTPLNGIINYIGFVVDDYLDSLNKEQKGHLTRALQGAENLEQLINNILDMSKIEAGQMTLNTQPTSLIETVKNISPLVDEMIGDKPVRFVTEISPDLPYLMCDQLRLRQIVTNMVSNAIKFTDSGTVQLIAYPENGNVILQVTDTGSGIDEEILPTIFQQFTGSGFIDANQHAGPGLSMPITKSLVELHGGKLDVDSHVGLGTTFTVTLPIQQNIEVVQ